MEKKEILNITMYGKEIKVTSYPDENFCKAVIASVLSQDKELFNIIGNAFGAALSEVDEKDYDEIFNHLRRLARAAKEIEKNVVLEVKPNKFKS